MPLPDGVSDLSLRGYIVVNNALSSQQVETINAILDQKIAEGRWHIADKQHRP